MKRVLLGLLLGALLFAASVSAGAVTIATGWTSDKSNPANVDSHGGSLTLSHGLLDTGGGAIYTRGGTIDQSDGNGNYATAVQGNTTIRDDRPGHSPSLSFGTAGVIDLGGVDGVLTDFGSLYPASPPMLPANPTAQDIAAALVQLGLVTQAAP